MAPNNEGKELQQLMKPIRIVYTSNTGHTEQYARLLSKRTGLPAIALREAVKQLAPDTPVLYLGWLRANRVTGYRQAAGRFRICAVCGVGVCDTGALLAPVRKANSVPDAIPLFTMQGGLDFAKLKGVDRLIIRLLTKGMQAKKQRSPQEERMLDLLQTGANCVSEANLAPVLAWYEAADR